jgi:hypothetical protein
MCLYQARGTSWQKETTLGKVYVHERSQRSEDNKQGGVCRHVLIRRGLHLLGNLQAEDHGVLQDLLHVLSQLVYSGP